jgi:transcriptional regulator with XRE-family HTH domain
MLSNLKTALAARRLRQVELAQAIGISASTLSEFIHGRIELAPHFLARIAETLQADPGWLFSRVTHIPGLHSKDSSDGTAATAAA